VSKETSECTSDDLGAVTTRAAVAAIAEPFDTSSMWDTLKDSKC
jgi:hypothetical protein